MSAQALPAEGLLAASWLLIALPLAGAAVLLLGGRRTDRWGHLLGTATVVAAFVLAVLSTVQSADELADDVTELTAGEHPHGAAERGHEPIEGEELR